MTDSTARMRIMTLFVLLFCTAGIWMLPQLEAKENAQVLQVSFLDVGQGDSIFIETVHGTQVLIDGGATAGVLRELGDVMGLFDTDVDIVVGTHPDKDHIGGLVDVFTRYDVAMILTTENESETSVARAYKEAIENEGAEIVYARRGQVISLDASTTLEVLFPETDPINMESNASSIVLRLVYGDSSFLFTGDSPKRIEEYVVLQSGEHLKSDVLKVGHHGSRTSTSELFLDEVSPQYAVISAGKDNSYGHPHVEVTDMLFSAGVETLNTAEVGRITFVTDGNELWVE